MYLFREGFNALVGLPTSAWIVAFLTVITCLGIWTCITIITQWGRVKTQEFKIKQQKSDQYVRLDNATWRDGLPLELKPGQAIRVRFGNRTVRAIVRFRKNQTLAGDEIEFPEALVEKLGLDENVNGGDGVRLKLSRPSRYSFGQLWNHPDIPTQIGVRVGAVLTLVSIVIEIAAGYIFN